MERQVFERDLERVEEGRQSVARVPSRGPAHIPDHLTDHALFDRAVSGGAGGEDPVAERLQMFSATRPAPRGGAVCRQRIRGDRSPATMAIHACTVST